MPKYSYICKECDERFEKTLKIDDREEPLTEPCPSCGTKHKVERLIEVSNFIYNPSGQIRTTDSFNDRLIEIKKTKGRDNTINTRRSAI